MAPPARVPAAFEAACWRNRGGDALFHVTFARPSSSNWLRRKPSGRRASSGGLVRAGMTTALHRRGARDRIGRETSALVVLLLRERAVIRSTAQDAGVRAVASLVDTGTRHGRPRASTRGSPSIPP